ncbi:MAG: DUF4845 domain-containing protein [Stenotrophobium sp.]
MQSRRKQRGLGWFGLLIMFCVLGFMVLVFMTCIPLYLNQMKITNAAHAVAQEQGTSGSLTDMRKGLQRYWDINSIDTLQPKDVIIKRTDKGRFLSYSYEARGHLFYNVFVVIDFAEDIPITGAAIE